MRFPKTSLKAKALMDKTREFREQIPKRFQASPISNSFVISLIPNIVTLMGLCVGLSAIRFALSDQVTLSVICILVAAVIDTLDGGLARMLNSSSAMGAELDSLSDIVTFGVSPAVLLYVSIFNKIQPFGWMVVLVFVSCIALRLARFNVMSQEEDQPEWKCRFFIGVPAPMGAYLSLSPTMFFLYSDKCILSEFFYALYIFMISFLVVSRIPTFSIKRVAVHKRYIVPIMVLSIFSIAFLMTEPWLALSVFGIIYLGMIPISYSQYNKFLKDI